MHIHNTCLLTSACKNFCVSLRSRSQAHLPLELLGVAGQQAGQAGQGVLPDALAVVAHLAQKLLYEQSCID